VVQGCLDPAVFEGCPRMQVEDVRELLYLEILEYHPVAREVGGCVCVCVRVCVCVCGGSSRNWWLVCRTAFVNVAAAAACSL